MFRKNTHIYFAVYWNTSKTVGYLIITRKLLSKYLIQKSQSVLEMSAILSNSRLIIFLAQYEIFNFTDTGSRARATTTWLSVDTSSNIDFLSKVFTPLTFQCLSRNILHKQLAPLPLLTCKDLIKCLSSSVNGIIYKHKYDVILTSSLQIIFYFYIDSFINISQTYEIFATMQKFSSEISKKTHIFFWTQCIYVFTM